MLYVVEIDSGTYPGEVCFLVELGFGQFYRSTARRAASKFPTKRDAAAALRGAQAEIAYIPPEMLSAGLGQRLEDARIVEGA
jgi:hypothetical protein